MTVRFGQLVIISKENLGLVTPLNQNRAVQVTDSPRIRLPIFLRYLQVSNHTVFLKSDGTVWATGYNSNGELGTGGTGQAKN